MHDAAGQRLSSRYRSWSCRRPGNEAARSRSLSMGRRHDWFAAKPLSDREENTDRWGDSNFVVLMPRRFNLTAETWLQQLLDTEALQATV